MAQIPNWIIRIEEKGKRNQALDVWADLQRAREKAQLEYAQVLLAAHEIFDSTINDAAVKRDRGIYRAKDAYEKAKEAIVQAEPVTLIKAGDSG